LLHLRCVAGLPRDLEFIHPRAAPPYRVLLPFSALFQLDPVQGLHLPLGIGGSNESGW
jgi:hypothetical protein